MILTSTLDRALGTVPKQVPVISTRSASEASSCVAESLTHVSGWDFNE